MGWKRRRRKRMKIADLFYREETTEAVLEFLRTTGVGMYPPKPAQDEIDESGSEE